jgi:hypothetical protein
MIENTLEPEENQVVNLILIGVFSPHKMAFVLDTSMEEINDRLLSIQLKWKISGVGAIRDKAIEQGYLLFEETREANKIEKEHLTFFNQFLGDMELVRLTGNDKDFEYAQTVPWKEIRLALKIAEQIVRTGTSSVERKRYKNTLRYLSNDEMVRKMLISQVRKKTIVHRAN